MWHLFTEPEALLQSHSDQDGMALGQRQSQINGLE